MDSTQLNPSYPQAMATPQKGQQFSIHSLLSPPESKVREAFNSPVSIAMSRTPSASFSFMTSFAESNASSKTDATRSLLLSPPISPYTTQTQEMDKDEGDGVKDFPLFSRADSATAEDVALFPPNEFAESDNLMQTTIKDTCAENAAKGISNAPTEEEYTIAVKALTSMPFKSIVYREFNKDPQGYYRRESAILDRYKSLGHSTSKSTTDKKTVISPSYRRLAPAPSGGVRKPRVPLPRIRNNPKPKRTPTQKVYDDFSNSFAYSPPTPTAKAPKAVTSRDDVDFQVLPDFSPPADSLMNSKAMKVDWKGQSLDLSSDPDRHLLHEAEVHVAATLRLSCATYLCSKRRIFIARRDAFRRGKEFRKTDAQQACKIDVNKASKLWTAFDRVGWFQNHWVSAM